MEIFHDEYSLEDVRSPDGQSDDEYDEADEYAEPVATSSTTASAEEAVRIPRYCANFHFGVIEGTMRIYPPVTARPTTAALKISNNPRFEYIWRGRETGESEIQQRADENVFPITFGNHGTTFEGTFHCEYLRPVTITGSKITHGRGQKMSSAGEWNNLTERSWERESRRRWGGW